MVSIFYSGNNFQTYYIKLYLNSCIKHGDCCGRPYKTVGFWFSFHEPGTQDIVIGLIPKVSVRRKRGE